MGKEALFSDYSSKTHIHIKAHEENQYSESTQIPKKSHFLV